MVAEPPFGTATNHSLPPIASSAVFLAFTKETELLELAKLFSFFCIWQFWTSVFLISVREEVKRGHAHQQ